MKDLQSYFDKAKRDDDLISKEEINDIITNIDRRNQAKPWLHIPPIFKTHLFIYVSLTFSIMLIATILSVVMLQTTPKTEQVYVPESQQRLMKLVSALNQVEENGSIKIVLFNKTEALQKKLVKATNVIPAHLRSKFELTMEKLEQVGILFKENAIVFEGNVKGHGYIALRIGATSHSVQIEERERIGVKTYESYPWFLSDEHGKQGVRYQFDSEPDVKMTNEFFENTLDQLIPIQVNRPGFKKTIFWFRQTDELMKVLESSANVLSDNPQPEQQVSTIKLELYPTITKGKVTANTTALEKTKFEISVLNSSGEVLDIPVKNQTLEPGDHNFEFDLSAYENGLYFIRVKSHPGLVTIHRLFKK